MSFCWRLASKTHQFRGFGSVVGQGWSENDRKNHEITKKSKIGKFSRTASLLEHMIMKY